MSTRVAPPSPPFLTARWMGGSQTPALVVIHSAVMPCQPGMAAAMVNAFRGVRKASAHYGVDPENDRQYVGDHTVAFHCGYNEDSLAVEMCDIPGPVPDDKPGTARWKALKRSWRWSRPNQRKMLRRTARLTARLCLAYGIPVRYVGRRRLLVWDRNGRRPQDGGITTHAAMSKTFKRSVHWDPGWWPRWRFLRMVRREAWKLQRQAAAR